MEPWLILFIIIIVIILSILYFSNATFKFITNTKESPSIENKKKLYKELSNRLPDVVEIPFIQENIIKVEEEVANNHLNEPTNVIEQLPYKPTSYPHWKSMIFDFPRTYF